MRKTGRPEHRRPEYQQERQAYAELFQTKAIFPTKTEVERNQESSAVAGSSKGKTAQVVMAKKKSKSRFPILLLWSCSFWGGGACNRVDEDEISKVAKHCETRGSQRSFREKFRI